MPQPTPELSAFLSHRDFVRNLARSLLANPADVDDIEQQTWMSAMQMGPAEVRDRRSWLSRVVRNHAFNRVRQGKRTTHREESVARPEGADGGQAIVDRVESGRSLVRAVLRVAEPNRSALLLRYYEDKGVSVIARELGVRPGVIKGRIQRGLAELRETLVHGDGRSEDEWRSELSALAFAPLPAKAVTLGAVGAATLRWRLPRLPYPSSWGATCWGGSVLQESPRWLTPSRNRRGGRRSRLALGSHVRNSIVAQVAPSRCPCQL